MNKIWLLVGLGNPGIRYELTRHNVGFLFIDNLIDKHEEYIREGAKEKDVKWWFLQSPSLPPCLLAKPQTYMNLSGRAVEVLCNRHCIPPSRLLVIHDDLDIKFGKIKLKWNGGSAGHRGVNSIISHLSTRDFYRIRIGIGRPEQDNNVTDYVLSPFKEEELILLGRILEAASEGCTIFLSQGLERGSNYINGFTL